MKENKKIVLSALVATAVLAFSGCGGGGDTGATTTPVTPELPIELPPVVADATLYSGLGAADISVRHMANDAMYTNLPSYDMANVVVLTGAITTDMTLDATKQYELSGLVTVKNGATLTVPAGTVIFGNDVGDDFLVIAKGSKIMAEGTMAKPITFTSEIALKDPLKADVGQWGGLTILGDAPTNHVNPFYEVDETNPDFAFGGTNATDSSGVLKYVKILNSGVTMSTDQEVNGLSLAGVGSGTVVENITVVNSSDDCIEIWGGTVNVTDATMINCQDDGFDLDYGYVGNATNIYVYQTDVASNAGMEISSGGTTPPTSPTITNFIVTKILGTDEGGIYIKDDTTAPRLINGHITTQGIDAGIFTKKAGLQAGLSFQDVIFNSPTLALGVGAAEAIATITYPTYKISNSEVLTGDITVDTTLVNTKQYEVSGLVTVKSGVTLTVQAGTVVYGDSLGDDYIVVAKGAKIMAEGTPSQPIYFTSKEALLDPTKADVGQWGGLTILGDAPTNHVNPFYEVDETNPDFAFGGNNAADSSGSLTNVYVLNSGVTMSTDQEINGLSLAGVGSGTKIENIVVANSADDCIEIWGGTVNVTNATMVNCQDDGFDLDYGYIGTATNIYVQQTEEASNSGMEISSGGTNPMTSPVIRNFVVNKIANTDDGGIYIKDDTTAPTFINGMITTITDANFHTKKIFTAEQKSAIAFRDVILLKP
ncbi:right-handed parallel beta-helix repeat-containing protein [Sulfurimonas sp. MAG313]|nr:right-handed parallel beta-helix repeat-containing protein [Sulfurimonas sp. MAG313]MDF1881447.1 right-handed parallel beta-helix repeat-containing protein [Sulfurimonas sp. MAG313]